MGKQTTPQVWAQSNPYGMPVARFSFEPQKPPDYAHDMSSQCQLGPNVALPSLTTSRGIFRLASSAFAPISASAHLGSSYRLS